MMYHCKSTRRKQYYKKQNANQSTPFCRLKVLNRTTALITANCPTTRHKGPSCSESKYCVEPGISRDYRCCCNTSSASLLDREAFDSHQSNVCNLFRFRTHSTLQYLSVLPFYQLLLLSDKAFYIG